MTLHSTCLPSGRGLTIWLPPGYQEQPASPYPLLVLHDNQNLFDPDRAYVRGEHWRAGETAGALIAAGRIPPLVLAGIDHAGDDRMREFTPTPGGRRGAGQARRYAALVIDEVLPFLRRTYPVRTDEAGTGLGGSSLGGLVTLATAAAHPGVFGRLLVMSPSVWWDGRVILHTLRRHPLDPFTRIWIDIGRREGPRALADARRLRDVIGRSATLRYVEDLEGDHSERSWARRLPRALEFLFPPLPESVTLAASAILAPANER